MTLNEPLVRATMAHIRDESTLWNQGSYTSVYGCQTSHCFAGWALTLSGFTTDKNGFRYHPDGRLLRTSEEHMARDLLGFTCDQVTNVFFCFPEETGEEPPGYWYWSDEEQRAWRVEYLAEAVSKATGLEGL